MKGDRSGMATPRNPVPRAAIAEIDEALMAAAWWDTLVHTQIPIVDVLRLVVTQVIDMREDAGSPGNPSKPRRA